MEDNEKNKSALPEEEKNKQPIENKERSSKEKETEFMGEYLNYDPENRSITVMNDKQYFTERLDKQIAYFDKKSTYNQQRYKKLKTIEIIIAASIPVIIGFSTMSLVKNVKVVPLDTVFQVIAALSGVVIVVINNVFELENYFKFWKDYRVTCEALQTERFKYLTRTEPYDEEDAYPILVNSVETILNKENQKWQQMTKPKHTELLQKAEATLNEQFKRWKEEQAAKEKK